MINITDYDNLTMLMKDAALVNQKEFYINELYSHFCSTVGHQMITTGIILIVAYLLFSILGRTLLVILYNAMPKDCVQKITFDTYIGDLNDDYNSLLFSYKMEGMIVVLMCFWMTAVMFMIY